MVEEQLTRAKSPQNSWPVYNWFTEGFATVDLKEAKVLLAEVAS
jgi:hypothetical protein